MPTQSGRVQHRRPHDLPAHAHRIDLEDEPNASRGRDVSAEFGNGNALRLISACYAPGEGPSRRQRLRGSGTAYAIASALARLARRPLDSGYGVRARRSCALARMSVRRSWEGPGRMAATPMAQSAISCVARPRRTAKPPGRISAGATARQPGRLPDACAAVDHDACRRNARRKPARHVFPSRQAPQAAPAGHDVPGSTHRSVSITTEARPYIPTCPALPCTARI